METEAMRTDGMQTDGMQMEEVIDRLSMHRTIGQAPRPELRWIAEHGTVRRMEQGEIVSRPSEPVDGLYIVLSGRMAIYMNRGTGVRRMMEWAAGDVTGMLPYSRMIHPPGETLIEEPTVAVKLPSELLGDLVRECPEVTGMLVHVMTDRARRFTSVDLRDEKIFSLGKLAAGFAHEVNNPASAVLRDAHSLAEIQQHTDAAARILFAAGLTPAQLAAIDVFCSVCKSEVAGGPKTGLEVADREDTLAAWLKAHGVDEGLAVDLARTPATNNELERLAGSVKGKALEAALRWVAAACAGRVLVADIERAAGRIHELVSAVKGFTHMDRAPEPELLEVRRGLAETVAILRGKARAKQVDLLVDIPEDLPMVRGYAAELNQVWMNLIDNAVDAAPKQGHVEVRARLEGPDVLVAVVDDGPGVPPELSESIFDPFFTTKPVGEGTGLGLDITRRVVHWHNGEIRLDSRPGRTAFTVRLPVGGPG